LSSSYYSIILCNVTLSCLLLVFDFRLFGLFFIVNDYYNYFIVFFVFPSLIFFTSLPVF